jgi:hypothetical protein
MSFLDKFLLQLVGLSGAHETVLSLTMEELISGIGKDTSRVNLVWFVPRTRQLDKHPLVLGENNYM